MTAWQSHLPASLSAWHAYTTASAWLPDDAVAMPLPSSSSVSDAICTAEGQGGTACTPQTTSPCATEVCSMVVAKLSADC